VPKAGSCRRRRSPSGRCSAREGDERDLPPGLGLVDGVAAVARRDALPQFVALGVARDARDARLLRAALDHGLNLGVVAEVEKPRRVHVVATT
jgi:hypothetical protein